MQPLWYGDRRDRVKWGALLYLADRFHLSQIFQVAFWRNGRRRTMKVGGDRRDVPIPDPVWSHFSDLQRVRQLGRRVRKDIVVIDTPFLAHQRREYVRGIIDKLQRHPGRKLLFLDPDTGIQPLESAGPEHATTEDLREFWASLHRGDLLAVYQHGMRRPDWRRVKRDQLRSACDGSSVKDIWAPAVSRDMAVLWTRKG